MKTTVSPQKYRLDVLELLEAFAIVWIFINNLVERLLGPQSSPAVALAKNLS